GGPADGARLLVEGEVPLARRADVGPSRAHDAHHQPVLVHERDKWPAPEAGSPPELLAEPVLPDGLAGLVGADDLAVHVLGVDVAGLGIPGDRRPAHPAERDGRVVDDEAPLPEPLVGARVPAGDHLLARWTRARTAVRAHATLEDDGRRAAAEVVAP